MSILESQCTCLENARHQGKTFHNRQNIITALRLGDSRLFINSAEIMITVVLSARLSSQLFGASKELILSLDGIVIKLAISTISMMTINFKFFAFKVFSIDRFLTVT